MAENPRPNIPAYYKVTDRTGAVVAMFLDHADAEAWAASQGARSDCWADPHPTYAVGPHDDADCPYKHQIAEVFGDG